MSHDLDPSATAATILASKPSDFPVPLVASNHVPHEFIPLEPADWEDTELTFGDVGPLAMKFLLNVGSATGRRIANQMKLPFGMVQELLRSLKTQMLVSYKGTSLVSDYEYELTQAGQERARQAYAHCTYSGAAPVSLEDYFGSIEKQSFRKCRPRMAAVRQAYDDMLLNDEMLSQIGQAANSARALFLYGDPGNGKSSIAERIVKTAGDHIWIPRTLSITGDIIRLFDPANHQEAPLEACGQILQSSKIDNRWVRINRPTVIVGGELTLDQLEVTFNPARGINEAPLQLKSNCGALVIDDFGRQRATPAEILNRFIIPLGKGHDYICLPSGRQVQAPFDQMLIFATNREPTELFDEAFLRRIPYKVQTLDPTEKDFRNLFSQTMQRSGISVQPAVIDHLIAIYKRQNRPFRYCHASDLMQQIETFCDFAERPVEITRETIDIACKNYFAGI